MESIDAIEVLSALAQTTRLAAFRLLVRKEPEGLPAGEIARELEIPQNTLSSHLGILAGAGLVRAQRDGRSIIYRADPNQVSALSLFLLRDCCAGELGACAPLVAELCRRNQ